jgi:hypothetical protein
MNLQNSTANDSGSSRRFNFISSIVSKWNAFENGIGAEKRRGSCLGGSREPQEELRANKEQRTKNKEKKIINHSFIHYNGGLEVHSSLSMSSSTTRLTCTPVDAANKLFS